MKNIIFILLLINSILLLSLTNIMFQQNGEIQELKQEKQYYVNMLEKYEN